MNYNILRKNDIRGEYPSEVNKDVAYKVGRAFGTYLGNLNQHECVIGHDNRLSSDELNEGLKSGLIDSGITVIDLGLVSTAIFNYGSILLNKCYGIMITASHNQATDNGFKIFGENYLHLEQSELQKFYDIIKSDNFVSGVGDIRCYNVVNDYNQMMIDKFGIINKRVVVDCGNGTVSNFIKPIYSKIFKDVTFLNSTSDGSFPIHNPDPNVEDNLKWLKSIVKIRHADLGISIDGDGDRVGIVTENGEMIGTDLLIGIFAREIIPNSENKNVIMDIKCSCALEHDLLKIGATPVVTENGSAFIERMLYETPALIGGEYSGHIFFRDDFYGFDDGLYAGLRIAKLIDKKHCTCSSLLEGFEKFLNTPEIRVEVDDNIKNNIVEEIKQYTIEKGYNANYVDGVRVNYDDGFALVRCSNTGPFITLRFEAKDDDTLNKRKEEFMNLISDYMKN